MASVPWFLTAFFVGMTLLLFWGGFLGFINGYTGVIWVLALMTGLAVITLLGILHDEIDLDEFQPRRTSTSTSRKIVHIERPKRRFERYSDDDQD